MLFLFSGERRENDMQRVADQYGFDVSVDFIDAILTSQHDMLDDLFADALTKDVLNGCYDEVTMSPPCSSDSAIRGSFGGPPPLRGADDVSIYGLPDLDQNQTK